ncbi:NAD(P)-dependent oxidoreductase, partial [Vibrio sp. 10N.286.52.C3]|uniref:SDR family oxidoreductase n=1 Tax=Vibrio sp. 10N.286.52.C3 TaxID=3229713 RepID=UPI00354C0B2F
MKLLIIGVSGLLGSSLVRRLVDGYEVVTVTRNSNESDFQVDMSDEDACLKLLEHVKPDVIINLAAVTSVDLCEENISLAYRVNTGIPKNLKKYEKGRDVFIIHISTDHFYNQEKSDESQVIIINNYAMTKYAGELALQESNAVILRTNFFGYSHSGIQGASTL